MSDISINLGGYRINLRVGAVIRLGGAVLTCRLKGQSWRFLPGGRVKAGESSLEALDRELREEIGEGFRILRPAISSENFFDLDGVRFHELCTYYDAEWLGEPDMSLRSNSRESFEWIPIGEIPAMNLKPSFLEEHILHPNKNLKLTIHRDL
jgi:ADP-ribose pyrophosphatase YjhB (NUDIX family)